MPAGYSGTPLLKKLGMTGETRLTLIGAPADYESLIGEWPDGLIHLKSVTKTTNLVHLFVTERVALERELKSLRAKLSPDAAVWVSWPKKTWKVPTTVTEDTIRAVALLLGFVDIKVCAVSDIWSGLKLVVRKELRGA